MSTDGYLYDLDPDAPLCPSGKRPHRTEELALDHLRQVRANRPRSGGGRKPNRLEGSAYQCKACKWWHLTALTTKRRRRRT